MLTDPVSTASTGNPLTLTPFSTACVVFQGDVISEWTKFDPFPLPEPVPSAMNQPSRPSSWFSVQ